MLMIRRVSPGVDFACLCAAFVFVTFILLLFCFFVNVSPPLQPAILPAEESFFRVLVSGPAPGILQVSVGDYRGEWTHAEDVAPAAGKPVQCGGG